MSVSTGIVAHTSRRLETGKLLDLLGEYYRGQVYLDDGTLGCEGNHLRTWRGAHEHAVRHRLLWCVVLEDDAVPVDHYCADLEMALDNAPSPVVSLYLGRGRPEYAQKKIERAIEMNRPYCVASRLYHCVAVAIRTDLVPGMIETATKAVNEADKAIDEAITEWCKQQMWPVAYANPSLVEHADGPSLTRHRGNDRAPVYRKAWVTGTRTDWWRGTSAMLG